MGLPRPTKPTVKGDDRNVDGTFKKGWKGGPGNPHSKAVNRLRSRLYKRVTLKEIDDVITELLRLAKGGYDVVDKDGNVHKAPGDITAIKEVLSRTLGKPEAVDLIARLDELEAKISPKGPRRLG